MKFYASFHLSVEFSFFLSFSLGLLLVIEIKSSLKPFKSWWKVSYSKLFMVFTLTLLLNRLEKKSPLPLPINSLKFLLASYLVFSSS
jgi:hypothetical protein